MFMLVDWSIQQHNPIPRQVLVLEMVADFLLYCMDLIFWLLVVAAVLVRMDKVVLEVVIVVVTVEQDQIMVEEHHKVVEEVVDHQMIEMVGLATLGIMDPMFKMVETLVVLDKIKATVVAAVELVSLVAVAVAVNLVATVLAAVAAEVQESSVVLGQAQYLKVDKMELVEVEVL